MPIPRWPGASRTRKADGDFRPGDMRWDARRQWKSYSTAQSQRGSLSSGARRWTIATTTPTRSWPCSFPKKGPLHRFSFREFRNPKRARTVCTSTSWSTMSRPKSAGCKHSALVASTMACRASGERDGSECRTLSRTSSASPPACSGSSRSGESETLRGVSQRQTQRFQLSPQRQPFLERQLMRRYLGNAVERHIQFVECRMDLLFSNGRHAATLSLGTDNSPASEPAAGHQLRGDHVALDLVGAFADDHQRRVAEVPLDVVFGGISIAAVDAHGIQRDLHRHFGGEQLGHPGLHVAALAAVVTLGGITRQLAGGGEFGCHLGQIVADRLMLPDRLSEAL